MDFLNTWIQGIIISVIIATIIEMILPSGNSKKYIKVVLGVYVVFNIVAPVVNKLSNNNFELSSIINIDKYTEKMQTYEASSCNINMTDTNEETIKQLYISKLEKDMKSKLEEKNYIVNNINIEVEDDEEYTIKNVTIYIEKNNEENNSESEKNTININEIENINIQINNIVNKDTTEESEKNSNISEKEKKEIKEYLASVYEIKEKQININ